MELWRNWGRIPISQSLDTPRALSKSRMTRWEEIWFFCWKEDTGACLFLRKLVLNGFRGRSLGWGICWKNGFLKQIRWLFNLKWLEMKIWNRFLTLLNRIGWMIRRFKSLFSAFLGVGVLIGILIILKMIRNDAKWKFRISFRPFGGEWHYRLLALNIPNLTTVLSQRCSCAILQSIVHSFSKNINK